MRGGGELDELRKDARVFGATEESTESAHGADEEDFGIWPENWAAWQAFLSVSTQWSVSMNGPTGLDYTRVKAGLELAGFAVTPELWQKLRVIESTVLSALAQKDKETERK